MILHALLHFIKNIIKTEINLKLPKFILQTNVVPYRQVFDGKNFVNDKPVRYILYLFYIFVKYIFAI